MIQGALIAGGAGGIMLDSSTLNFVVVSPSPASDGYQYGMICAAPCYAAVAMDWRLIGVSCLGEVFLLHGG